MIRELPVRAGQLDLRHMARDAVFFRHAACRPLPAAMAGQALRVISAALRLQWRMGIVAGGAADAGILRVIAFAVGQAVRLEADVLNSSRTFDRDLRPRAMALPAEVRHLLGRKFSQLVRRSRRILQMPVGRPVAALTLDARNRLPSNGRRNTGGLRRLVSAGPRPQPGCAASTDSCPIVMSKPLERLQSNSPGSQATLLRAGRAMSAPWLRAQTSTPPGSAECLRHRSRCKRSLLSGMSSRRTDR